MSKGIPYVNERVGTPSLRSAGHYKGESRDKKNSAQLSRRITDEQHRRDSTPNCRYAAGDTASRKKGRQRFKPGRKQ